MIWYLPLLTRRRPKTPVERLLARRRSYFEVILRIVGGQFLKAGLASVVIWFVALPLVMNQFHLVSPSALVLNLYLWIPMALSLFCGFGILLVGSFCSSVAQALAWGCNAALSWMEGSVQFAEPLWGSYFWVAGPATTVVVIFYAILIAGVLCAGSHRWWPLWTSLAFFLVFVNCWTTNLRPVSPQPAELTCTFLSVGHGVCAILEFSTGEVWMYDAGSLGSARSSTAKISEFLWSRGITRLDALLLSHADVDHFNAVPGIIERFHVRRAVVSPAMFALGHDSVSALNRALQTGRVPIQVVDAGTALHDRGGVRADVIHPRSGLAVESDNANSLVVAVSCAGRRLLLTGDLADSGLADLLSQSPIDCDVVLAPHHGSVRSQPATFCAWCSPEWVVVSSSLSDIRDAGPQEYAAVGCQVMHTAARGAVRVQLSAAGTQVSSFCSLKLADSFP